jgi:hypothetical protein
MRKLAREAVIFCLLGAVIAGVVALVFERNKILAEKAEAYTHVETGRFQIMEPCEESPAGFVKVEPCAMDGKVIQGFSESMCAGVLRDGKCSKLSSEGVTAEARAPFDLSAGLVPKGAPLPPLPAVRWNDAPRLLYVFVGLGLIIGFPAGLGIWLLYRMVRFAFLG